MLTLMMCAWLLLAPWLACLAVELPLEARLITLLVTV
jgi:hypothetical protein